MQEYNEDITNQVIEDIKERESAYVSAKEIAKLFQGKSVKTCMIILNQIEDIIKQSATFSF